MEITKKDALEYLRCLTHLESIANINHVEYNKWRVESMMRLFESIIIDDQTKSEPKITDSDDDFELDVYHDDVIPSYVLEGLPATKFRIISSSVGFPDENVILSFIGIAANDFNNSIIVNALHAYNGAEYNLKVNYVRRSAKKIEFAQNLTGVAAWHSFSTSKFSPDFVSSIPINKILKIQQ